MFNGIADSIAEVLRSDITSGQASAWVAAYPTFFTGGASSVAPYNYMCLREIWGVTDATRWPNYVASIFGTGNAQSKTIDVCSYLTKPQSEWDQGNSPGSNESGAEGAEIYIYLKLPDNVPSSEYNRVAQATERIRHLIDYNIRVNNDHKPYYLSGNPMIRDDRPLKVYEVGTVCEDIKSASMRFFAFYTLTCLVPPAGG